jgi:hypothetical protein
VTFFKDRCFCRSYFFGRLCARVTKMRVGENEGEGEGESWTWTWMLRPPSGSKVAV